jgi:hypothetical protein
MKERERYLVVELMTTRVISRERERERERCNKYGEGRGRGRGRVKKIKMNDSGLVINIFSQFVKN